MPSRRRAPAPVRPPVVRRPPKGGQFADPHGTMTNITWHPDQQEGLGNGGFQDAVYRPQQECQPVQGGGGFFGGILGALLGGAGAGGGECAAPEVEPLSPKPDTMWV